MVTVWTWSGSGPALPYSPLLQGPSHPNSTSLCWGLDPCEQFCLILSAKLQNYATVSLLRSLLYFAFARIIFPHFWGGSRINNVLGGLSPLYLGSCRKCLVRLLQWMRMGLVYQNQVDDQVVLLAVSANRGGPQFHWCLQTFSILRWPQCLWSTPLLDVSHALRVQPGTEMIAANCPLSIHLVTWPMLQQCWPYWVA